MRSPRNYVLHNPMLQKSWLDGIHPELTAYLNAPSTSNSPLESLSHNTYSFPLFTKEWCSLLHEEFNHYDHWILSENLHHSPPNSMHEYGVVLSDLGFDTCLQELMDKVIMPLISQLYPEVGSHKLDSFHAFSVQYGAHGDRDLGFHVDASDVTLNLCLGESWEGGELYFQGRRCALHRQESHRDEEHWEYQHEPTKALIHAGKHRHGVLPITSGFRRNIIIWYSAGEYVDDEECPSWCQHNP